MIPVSDEPIFLVIEYAIASDEDPVDSIALWPVTHIKNTTGVELYNTEYWVLINKYTYTYLHNAGKLCEILVLCIVGA